MDAPHGTIDRMHEREEAVRAIDVDAAHINADAAKIAQRTDELLQSVHGSMVLARGGGLGGGESGFTDDERERLDRLARLASKMAEKTKAIRSASGDLQQLAGETSEVLAARASYRAG